MTAAVWAQGWGSVADGDGSAGFPVELREGDGGSCGVLETPWAKLETGISRDLAEQTVM